MATGNNRKENTFRPKVQAETDPIESQLIVTDEPIIEEKPKKEPQKKATKSKEAKPQKNGKKQESDGRVKRIIGILFLCLAVFLGIALVSYLFSYYGGSHQEFGNQVFEKSAEIDSQTGSTGFFLAQTLIKESFGLGAFFFIYLLTIIGLKLATDRKINLWSIWKYALMCLVWIPLFFAFISVYAPKCSVLGGAVGRWLNNLLMDYTGWIGVLLILIFLFLVFAIYQFNLTLNYFKQRREKKEEESRRQAALIAEQRIKDEIERERSIFNNNDGIEPDDVDSNENRWRDDLGHDDLDDQGDHLDNAPLEESNDNLPPVTAFTREPEMEIVHETVNKKEETEPKNDVTLEITETPKEETIETGKGNEHFTIDTPFDPRYELSDYKFPTLDMLNDYGGKKSEIDEAELQANKNKIVETLGKFGIGIDHIKATIGPTVTLYEIIPAAGIRISKIKNLEDDIALSLAALGIRIIAPIPGKGTIGIEVPNSKPETVSMRSVLSSEKFQNSKYALPCAIGKTISNETYVFDLAKMPHILMAGATGQGKSVGLNAIIASLLYSKHPSELKFVMVDPKKVELTLYNRIERHYLAKLPDSEDAIITDVKKVVRTLNSLCIEMDQRYDLLKAAECRNVIEYNEKFKSRRLLPTEGHRYLPYIVLVVDEFADLIMTAGRDVEAPIARIAQLARAVGIHLIIATQRPSVNIITGSIKANFPARIAFRVISQVDSKTILDQSGANQLIGRGDMLLSTGNDLVRLQCAFIDTPEVEAVTEFIGNQRGYAEPFLLPEVPEDEGEGVDIEEDGERDSLFEEAARIVVQTQQGSTSMIQRKLKLGYNRAGRIIDQLEAAGIVGPFSGSKSREVKVSSETALEQILRDIYNKDNGI